MSGQAPHADLRRGTVTWDAEAGEYVADHGRPYGQPTGGQQGQPTGGQQPQQAGEGRRR